MLGLIATLFFIQTSHLIPDLEVGPGYRGMHSREYPWEHYRPIFFKRLRTIEGSGSLDATDPFEIEKVESTSVTIMTGGPQSNGLIYETTQMGDRVARSRSVTTYRKSALGFWVPVSEWSTEWSQIFQYTNEDVLFRADMNHRETGFTTVLHSYFERPWWNGFSESRLRRDGRSLIGGCFRSYISDTGQLMRSERGACNPASTFEHAFISDRPPYKWYFEPGPNGSGENRVIKEINDPWENSRTTMHYREGLLVRSTYLSFSKPEDSKDTIYSLVDNFPTSRMVRLPQDQGGHITQLLKYDEQGRLVAEASRWYRPGPKVDVTSRYWEYD